MGAPAVRRLATGDDLSGLAPLDGASPVGDPRVHPNALVVLDGDAVAGLAVCGRLGQANVVEGLSARPGHADRVLVEVVAAFAGDRVELLATDPGPELARAAEQAGFDLVYEQMRVRRSLATVVSPRRRRLTFRRYAEVGRRGLAALLGEIWTGGAGPHGLPAGSELERFLALAQRSDSGPPDTSLWRVAYVDGEPAGVALILALEQLTGTLLYLGVLPECRGRRIGSALHAESLWLMHYRGLKHYEDSTTVDNEAMLRIFAGAGCEPAGSRVLWVCDSTAPAAMTGAEPALPGPMWRAVRRHPSLLRVAPASGKPLRGPTPLEDRPPA